MVDLVSKIAEELSKDDLDVEMIDLRTVSPCDIDYETIGSSLKKTNVLVIAEQAPTSMSIGPTISHQCQKRFYNYLDSSITTISGLDIPTPVSKKLEEFAVPTLDYIQQTILKAAKRQF